MEFIQILLILFPSVILHEYAHGWVAYRLGDSTAKLAGRLTLNPLKHIDPVGTIILPGILLTMRALGYATFVLGWAKPVPVDFANLRHPRRDMMLVALAGPAVNIGLAVGMSLMIKISSSLKVDFPNFIIAMMANAIFINLLLAFFNLIPIPPLDGSRLVAGVLPSRSAILYSRMEPYGILIVMALLYLGVLNHFILPAVDFFTYYLTGIRNW